jgi:hypothetical protein
MHYAALKRRSFTGLRGTEVLVRAFLASAKGSGRGRPLYTGAGSGEFRIKVKVNVKGNGQECPFHTWLGVASLRGQPRAAVPT